MSQAEKSKLAVVPEVAPEDTTAYLSWGAVNFLKNPSVRIFQWAVIALLAIGFIAAIASSYLQMDISIDASGDVISSPPPADVVVPKGGYVSSVLKSVGSSVSKGEVVALVSPNDSENGSDAQAIRAPIAGVLGQLNVGPNTLVESNTIAAKIMPENSQWVARLHVSAADIVQVKEGQSVLFRMDAFPYEKYGLFEGTVTSVEPIKSGESFTVNATIAGPPDSKDLKDLKLMMGLEFQAKIVTGRKSVSALITDRFFPSLNMTR
jgi:multidrug efflux pump subunit AcrA (membrane-fusion protein)